MARKITTVCWGMFLLWSGLNANNNAIQTRKYSDLIAQVQSIAVDTQNEAASFWQNSFINPCRLFASTTSLQFNGCHSGSNTAPINETKSNLAKMDSYWQYYSDCDQWQVVFAGQVPSSDPRLTQVQVAKVHPDAVITQSKSNSDRNHLLHRLTAAVERTTHHWQRWGSATTERSLRQLQQWENLARETRHPLISDETAPAEQLPAEVNSGNPFRLASEKGNAKQKKLDDSTWRTSVADQLDWLGHGFLTLSQSLRDGDQPFHSGS